MRVYVYFNLHKKVWSVKALEGPRKGLVISHAENVNLIDAEFRVGKAGRARVLQEGVKNVHAGVVGTLHEPWAIPTAAQKVRYNPYLRGEFFDEEGQGVFKSKAVALKSDKSVWVW